MSIDMFVDQGIFEVGIIFKDRESISISDLEKKFQRSLNIQFKSVKVLEETKEVNIQPYNGAYLVILSATVEYNVRTLNRAGFTRGSDDYINVNGSRIHINQNYLRESGFGGF